MNPQIKARWIEALNSDKYPQGRSYLRINDNDTGTDRYCCLGVLTDIIRHEHGEQWPLVNSEEFLPANICEIAEISYSNPYVRTSIVLETMTPLEKSNLKLGGDEVSLSEPFVPLSVLNDAGLSFRTIAKIIEKSSL